ncbi:cold-shock protein [Phytobacter palmae]|uniref:Cold-shock protein n=1 Tax=Phytobacter palmae TaxID=1855371 RepID=A0ABU9V9C3_9ENTR
MSNIHLRCPKCHGSQYRVSHFDVTETNPYGAKCIFCKNIMVTNEHYSLATMHPVPHVRNVTPTHIV